MNTTSNTTSTATVTTKGRKPLKVKYPRGAFTVDQLFELNRKDKGGVVKCELTARNHIKRGLATALLVKLDKKLALGTVGAPAFRYMLKSRAEANQRNLAKAAAKRTAVEAPAEPVVA
jgi:hypothetical protein